MNYKETINELQFIVNVMKARSKDVLELSRNSNYSERERDMFTARWVELDKWKSALENLIDKAEV